MRLLPVNIAQAAFFPRVLSPAQRQSLCNAGANTVPVSLALKRKGAGGVTLSWPSGALMHAANLMGPWATNTVGSTYVVVPANLGMFFKVTTN